MARKPRMKWIENPVGCAGEGKPRKGYMGKENRTFGLAKFGFCD